jgi:hypothetical protein
MYFHQSPTPREDGGAWEMREFKKKKTWYLVIVPFIVPCSGNDLVRVGKTM